MTDRVLEFHHYRGESERRMSHRALLRIRREQDAWGEVLVGPLRLERFGSWPRWHGFTRVSFTTTPLAGKRIEVRALLGHLLPRSMLIARAQMENSMLRRLERLAREQGLMLEPGSVRVDEGVPDFSGLPLIMSAATVVAPRRREDLAPLRRVAADMFPLVLPEMHRPVVRGVGHGVMPPFPDITSMQALLDGGRMFTTPPTTLDGRRPPDSPEEQ